MLGVPLISRRTSEADLQTTQPRSTPKSDPVTNVLGQTSLPLFFGLKGKCWTLEDRTSVTMILKDPHQHSLPQRTKRFPVASASLFCLFLNRQVTPEHMISRVQSLIWAYIHNGGNSPNIKMKFKKEWIASTRQGTCHKAFLKSLWVTEWQWFGGWQGSFKLPIFSKF